VYAVCRRLTGNDADAADATQDALMGIVRGLPRFDGRSALSTWVHRVATNAALDELRRRRRRPLPGGDPFERAIDGPASPVDRRGDTPGLEQRVSDRLDLDAALAELPEAFRAAVVLRDVAGLDYAEIARVLDLPPGTVRSRIARGRASLARALTGAGGATAAPGVPGNHGAPVHVEAMEEP
jgi:RNA polymerase sigma-70 factor, ECF subfamily